MADLVLGKMQMAIWFALMLKVPAVLWQERIETRLFLMPGVGMGMWVLQDLILCSVSEVV